MQTQAIIISLAMTLFLSCKYNSEQAALPSNSTDTLAQAKEAGASGNNVVAAEGTLLEAEDSGYPFAYLVIEYGYKKTKEYFDIQLEEVKTVNMDDLVQMKGKKVSFTYTTELSDALLDIEAGGKSLIAEKPFDKKAETKTIEGILSGADEVTPGDLPGSVTITPSGGKAATFDFFVTEEMVKANGKKVKGYYETRTTYHIKSIDAMAH